MTDRHPSDQGMTADDALALDLVLGILRAPDLALAERRRLTDPAFAALVEAHRIQLLLLNDGSAGGPPAEEHPRASTWAGIKARLPASRKD